MMSGVDPQRGEGGETLVELMIAVAIIGLAVVGIIGGVFTAINVSDHQRKDSAATTVLRSFADELKSIDGTYAYVACATPGSYPAYAPAAPLDGYSTSITEVRYLSDASATTPSWSTSCPGTDQGAQRVTISVTSPAGSHQVTEVLDVVKRDARCDIRSAAPCA